jgi:ankyrin repeat protein
MAGVHHTDPVLSMLTPAKIDFTVPLSWVRQNPAEVLDLGTRNSRFYGYTPLHIAVARGQIAMAELLLNSGDVEKLKNFDGLGPMHLACKTGNVEMVKCLIKHGASLDRMRCGGFLQIHLAVTSGSPDLVRCAA